jgi:hypothetical protein
VTGDWDGNRSDTIGVFIRETSAWFLRNSNSSGDADMQFVYAAPSSATPLAGNWNGK